jgi:hypothetical protein
MHNFTVSGNPTQSMTAANVDVIENACNADFFTHFFSADNLGDGNMGTVALRSTGTINAPPYWSLLNGNTSGVTGYVRRHREWKDGFFKMRLHWNSTVADGSVVFDAIIYPIPNVTTFDSDTSNFNTVPPSSTAGLTVSEWISASLAEDSRINASRHGVYVGVQRRGGNPSDTCTGDVRVYGIEIEYIEARRRVGGKA